MKTLKGMGILDDLLVNVEACRAHQKEQGNVEIVLGQNLILQILTFAQVSLYFFLLYRRGKFRGGNTNHCWPSSRALLSPWRCMSGARNPKKSSAGGAMKDGADTPLASRCIECTVHRVAMGSRHCRRGWWGTGQWRQTFGPWSVQPRRRSRCF
jgi:hypothetical protein